MKLMIMNIIACLAVFLFGITDSTQAAVVFSDGFETYTAGAAMPLAPVAYPPVGSAWQDFSVYQGGPVSNDLVVTSPDPVKTGQNSLKMMRGGGTVCQLVAKGTAGTLADGVDVMILQDVYLPWWNGTVGGSCENYFGSPTKAGWVIDGAANIGYYQNGAFTSTGIGFERNAWNHYKMVFHLNDLGGGAFNGTWDFSVTNADGTPRVTRTGLTLGTFDWDDLTPRLFMYAGSTWGSNVAYYDNISMTIEDPACGGDIHPNPVGDLDGDCTVDLNDFALLAENWLVCTPIACP